MTTTTAQETAQAINNALRTLLTKAGVDTDWLDECDTYHTPDTHETNIYWTTTGIEDRGCSWREHYTVDAEIEEVRSIEDPDDFIHYISLALTEAPLYRVEIGTDHLDMLLTGNIPTQ